MQALCQRTPKRIQPFVSHLKHAAEVGELVAVQQHIRRCRVAINIASTLGMPSATNAAKKSRALRGWSLRRADNSSAVRGAFASSVNKPNSIALKSVFDPQKPRPSCMMLSGVIDLLSAVIAVSVDMFM